MGLITENNSQYYAGFCFYNSNRINAPPGQIVTKRVKADSRTLPTRVPTVKSRDKTGQLTNNRAPIPVSTQSTPSLGTMGRLQGKQKLDFGKENNRNGSEILDSLKKNPYALSIH